MSDSSMLQGQLNKICVSWPVSAFGSSLPAVLVSGSSAASADLTNSVKVI